MTELTTFPWLTALVALPLAGALVVLALGRASGEAAKRVTFGFSVLTLLLAAAVAARYDVGGGMQLTETYPWIAGLGVHFALGLDGLGLVMVLLTVVLVPLVLLASWPDADDNGPATFGAWVLALESFSLAVFLATDVFLFYVVFEATLIPAYFLIGRFGREGRGFAALKFLMYQLGGGLVMLAAVIGLYVASARSGSPSYLISDLARLDLATGVERWLFVGFFIAFMVKAPLFPLHPWLADMTEKATPGTSVLLVCILDKIGTFGMLRLCLGLFPEASTWATPVVVVIALVSIVYGALVAIGQDDILRLIGYTSLSHFGFITLGIFVFSSYGVAGAVLYMVNHGLATAALFLLAGYLIRRRGTSLISQMGGVEKAAPVLAGLLLVAGLATLGLPGLSPFVSEFLVLVAAFDHAWWAGTVAVTGIVLAAVYILWMYQRTMTGPLVGAGEVTDLGRREVVAVAPLVAGLLVFGFYPAPLLEVINPMVSETLDHVGVADDPPAVPVPEAAESARAGHAGEDG